jgi:hypothetical protein
MTKSERELYAKLARYGCILCKQQEVRQLEDSPTEMHHIRRYGGKRTNAPVIPLCAHHHRLGDTSIHALGHKGFEKYWGFSEEDLLEKLNDTLQKAGR